MIRRTISSRRVPGAVSLIGWGKVEEGMEREMGRIDGGFGWQ